MGGYRSYAISLLSEVCYLITNYIQYSGSQHYLCAVYVVKYTEWCHHKCVCACIVLAELRWRIIAGGGMVQWLTINIIRFGYISPVFSMFTSTDSLYSGELFPTMINVFQ